MQTLYVHIMNEDGVMAEVEDLPTPSDLYIKLMNPRKKDGKDLHYLMEGVSIMLLPWTRITFVEVVSSEKEEDVFTFVRD
jgi:hypothetical protein